MNDLLQAEAVRRRCVHWSGGHRGLFEGLVHHEVKIAILPDLSEKFREKFKKIVAKTATPTPRQEGTFKQI
jgi:hypothetical protein